MDKATPAYQRIKQSIIDNIHAGTWQEGQAIPTEHALTKQFGVSRMTVNRALKELSEARILERKQGSGTFVAQQKYKNIRVEITNIAQDIRASERAYQAKVISQRILGSSEISPILQSHFALATIEKTTQLYEVKIVHFADEEPVQLEERWVNARLAPEFIEQDFNVVNTSDYLINAIALEGGHYSILAKAASHEVATALQIHEHEPTLLLQRNTLADGQIVTFVNFWYAGSRYQFSGELG